MTSKQPTAWIDVDDLFHYVKHNARLSGIQRLTYELYTALRERAAVTGWQIGFVRIDAGLDEFVLVGWEEVRRLCHGLTTEHPVPEPAQPAPLPATPRPRQDLFTRSRAMSRHAALYINHRLPEPARGPFERYRILQVEALRSLVRIGRASVSSVIHATQHITARADGPRRLRAAARQGDWLLALGAPWHRPDYGDLLRCIKKDAGVRCGLLIYDLIPVRRPEWCHRTLVDTFGVWLDGVLPQADALFAISQATAQDLSALLAERGRADRVSTIPMGTGFPASRSANRARIEAIPEHALPKAGSYVLFVSTIEARKNHALMFQVWRNLSLTLPPDSLPTLVFAGRVGWLVSDLMTQIANTDYCNGKLRIIEDPSDAALTRLYEGCLFTVLPSLFEGWGLPVTESLSFGKPCVTSDNTALPEAGAGLTRMLDPYDLNDATAVIAAILSDRPALAAWQKRVRDQFAPVLWSRSADVLLHGLDERAGEHDADGIAAQADPAGSEAAGRGWPDMALARAQ